MGLCLKLRSVTCHMGSHSVTFHPTQVNSPGSLRPNPSHTGRLIYLPSRDGRLSWPRWLVTYRDGLPARRWSPPPHTHTHTILQVIFAINLPGDIAYWCSAIASIVSSTVSTMFCVNVWKNMLQFTGTKLLTHVSVSISSVNSCVLGFN